jgi:hypothetical protein
VDENVDDDRGTGSLSDVTRRHPLFHPGCAEPSIGAALQSDDDATWEFRRA